MCVSAYVMEKKYGMASHIIIIDLKILKFIETWLETWMRFVQVFTVR